MRWYFFHTKKNVLRLTCETKQTVLIFDKFIVFTQFFPIRWSPLIDGMLSNASHSFHPHLRRQPEISSSIDKKICQFPETVAAITISVVENNMLGDKGTARKQAKEPIKTPCNENVFES